MSAYETGLSPQAEERVRQIAQEAAEAAIASLAGKALRRLQDERFTRSLTHNEATDAAKEVAGHLWGEVLAEYGGQS